MFTVNVTLAQTIIWCWQQILFGKSGRTLRYKKEQYIKKFIKCIYWEKIVCKIYISRDYNSIFWIRQQKMMQRENGRIQNVVFATYRNKELRKADSNKVPPRDRFVREIEHDVNVRRMFPYKMLKHLTQSEKDMARISVIGKDRQIEHYRQLQFQEGEQASQVNDEIWEVKGIDLITVHELVNALKEKKLERQQVLMASMWNFSNTWDTLEMCIRDRISTVQR